MSTKEAELLAAIRRLCEASPVGIGTHERLEAVYPVDSGTPDLVASLVRQGLVVAISAEWFRLPLPHPLQAAIPYSGDAPPFPDRIRKGSPERRAVLVVAVIGGLIFLTFTAALVLKAAALW